MSPKRITYIHIFIWLFAIFANLPYAGLGTEMVPEMIVSKIIGFLYLMVVFYLFYIFLAPLFLNRKKLMEFFGFSFIVLLVMPFLGYSILFLSRAIFDGTFHDFYRGYSLKMHMSAFYPLLTSAVFGSFFSVIINWFTTMNQKAELDKQKLAVELDLLKSKLNPHFLFNTLNNIDFLIQSDPGEASSALIKLSEMMRYLTYETSASHVELSKEIRYVRNFIDLYRMRIREADEISFKVLGDADAMISPALFVPLMENAFKFASFRNNKPAIEILVSSEKGIVTFSISNNYENALKKSGENSGYGLLNLRKRLELAYPGKHELVTEDETSRYKVKLTIDTNAN